MLVADFSPSCKSARTVSDFNACAYRAPFHCATPRPLPYAPLVSPEQTRRDDLRVISILHSRARRAAGSQVSLCNRSARIRWPPDSRTALGNQNGITHRASLASSPEEEGNGNTNNHSPRARRVLCPGLTGRRRAAAGFRMSTTNDNSRKTRHALQESSVFIFFFYVGKPSPSSPLPPLLLGS